MPMDNNKVINFIEEFLGGQYASFHDRKLLQQKFSEGYCYYFAKMLNTAFDRGGVYWAAPIEHFIWQDIDGKCYDINGPFNIKEHGVYYLIPEDIAEPILLEYKHTRQTFGATKEEMIQIVKDYCKKYNKDYIDEIEYLL